MAFYNDNGTYAYDPCDPDYNGCPCQFHYTPREFKCPREFWSNESIFLENLHNEIYRMEREEIEFNRNHYDNRDNATAIMHPSRITDWRSPEFGSLSVFGLCVSIRLDNSLDADAEAAGLFTDRDIIEYYNNKKRE